MHWSAAKRLHYYDAASPIVAADSIDESVTYRKSRYEKGDGDDYLNIPLDRDAVPAAAPRSAHARTHRAQGFRGGQCVLRRLFADRRDGRSRRRRAALRPAQTGRPARSTHREDAACGRAAAQRERRGHRLSIWSAFKRVWRGRRKKRPSVSSRASRTRSGCASGVMHRNTFIDSPRLLDARLRLRGHARSISRGRLPAPKGMSKPQLAVR